VDSCTPVRHRLQVDRSIRIRTGRKRRRPPSACSSPGSGEPVGVVPTSAKHHVRLARKFTALKPTVPDTCPDRTPESTFSLVRCLHSNSLRSRERSGDLPARVRALLLPVDDVRGEARVGDQLGDNQPACPRTLADHCVSADLRNGRVSPGRNSPGKRKISGSTRCREHGSGPSSWEECSPCAPTFAWGSAGSYIAASRSLCPIAKACWEHLARCSSICCLRRGPGQPRNVDQARKVCPQEE
jgi:hypothetical protein